MITNLALFGPLGGWELLIIAVIGLLIFGKRLPEVGRSLGKGIVEFKKGLSGIEDDLEQAGKADTTRKLEQDTRRDASDADNSSDKT